MTLSAGGRAGRSQTGRVRHCSGTTVVVVEDNADSLEMLFSLLKLAGATCHSARDARAALALIDDVSTSVVVLDVGLQHLDGLEVARRIRSNPRPPAFA